MSKSNLKEWWCVKSDIPKGVCQDWGIEWYAKSYQDSKFSVLPSFLVCYHWLMVKTSYGLLWSVLTCYYDKFDQWRLSIQNLISETCT